LKPNTQAFIWTILIWLAIIPTAFFFILGMAVDPYFTYTDIHIITVVIIVTSPLLIIWLIGIATIYITGYIVGYIEKRENREREKIEREFNK